MTMQPTGPEGSGQHRRDQIAVDHHNLRVTIDQLLQVSELPLVIAHLRRLHTELVDHFKLEEGADGLAQAIGETAPNSLNKLSRLFEEHGEFLATIDKLIVETNACLNGPMAKIQGGIRTLCTQLEAHEVTETELISDAVFTDLGTSG
jgi:hypothetical protein